MNTYEELKNQIEKGGFSCIEDAIDQTQHFYKMSCLTLEQRNELLKISQPIEKQAMKKIYYNKNVSCKIKCQYQQDKKK